MYDNCHTQTHTTHKRNKKRKIFHYHKKTTKKFIGHKTIVKKKKNDTKNKTVRMIHWVLCVINGHTLVRRPFCVKCNSRDRTVVISMSIFWYSIKSSLMNELTKISEQFKLRVNKLYIFYVTYDYIASFVVVHRTKRSFFLFLF